VYKNEPLYLEFAPAPLCGAQKSTLVLREEPEDSNEKIVFVKNLNFETTDAALKAHFSDASVQLVSAKIVRKEGQSLGYGFVEFRSAEHASWCLKNRQNSILDAHALKLSLSKRGEKVQKKQERKAKVVPRAKVNCSKTRSSRRARRSWCATWPSRRPGRTSRTSSKASPT